MKTAVIAALLAAAAAAGAALPATAQVVQRQDNQAARINQGVRSGELTGHEARHLQRQQAHIARKEENMRARHGGRLTPRERARLARMQNHANRSIYNAKHNGRVG